MQLKQQHGCFRFWIGHPRARFELANCPHVFKPNAADRVHAQLSSLFVRANEQIMTRLVETAASMANQCGDYQRCVCTAHAAWRPYSGPTMSNCYDWRFETIRSRYVLINQPRFTALDRLRNHLQCDGWGVKRKFHLARDVSTRRDSTRSTCWTHAFELCRVVIRDLVCCVIRIKL